MTSPYQAIRTLHQLADDEAVSHPTASQVLRQNFYVDEVMTGRDSADELVELQRELISLLKRSGLLHSGLNITIAILRGRYCIIHGCTTIKGIIHQCVQCYHFQPLKSEQMIADLSLSRTTISKLFKQCGVDYAEPFTTRLPRDRTRVYTKSYLAFFICLVTEAVNLEVVSDLSTEAFIAALRRFVSRRRYPSTIMSDNGTNFVSANNTLLELRSFLQSTTVQEKVREY